MAIRMSLVTDSPGSRSLSSPAKHFTTYLHRPRLQWSAGLLLLLCCLVCRVSASSLDPAQPTETLVVDTRVPTKAPWPWATADQEEIKRRSLEARDNTNSTAPAATITLSIAVSATASASPLPSPLDGGLSSNFSKPSSGTNNCPTFFDDFLANPTFKQCYPFSLLLQGSTSFFQAEKSLVSITQVLDASCAANVTFCTSYLNKLAKNLTDSSNCEADYQLGNPLVVQTYIAMVSYQTLYSATCLKNPESGAYCFASAVTNTTAFSNVYFYYLPLNISLPGSSTPSCSWCLENTMSIYQSDTANRALPIADTYVSAAQQVDTICGPDFANQTLPKAVVVSGAYPASTPWPQWVPLVLPLLVGLLV